MGWTDSVYVLGVLFTLPIFFAGHVSATEDTARQYLPARWGEGEASFLARLRCPESTADEGKIVVICQTKVNTEGETRQSSCFTNQSLHRPFRRAAERALKHAQFRPATIDGDPVNVYLSLHSQFVVEGGRCSVSAFPNVGGGSEALEAGFYAPQEIVTGSGWYAYAKALRASYIDRLRAEVGAAFIMSADVSTQGEPARVELVRNGFAREKRVQRALEKFQNSKFIPGFSNDEPIPMKVYGIFYVKPVEK